MFGKKKKYVGSRGKVTPPEPPKDWETPSKYVIGDILWYIEDNQIQHNKVLGIIFISEDKEGGIGKWAYRFSLCEYGRDIYKHHFIVQNKVFVSKEALVASL